VPDQPPQAVLEELRAQVAELRGANARLREVIEAKDAQLAVAQAALDAAEARFAALSERVAELERRLGKDSSTSSKPPSSDSPYKKKPRDRSLRRRSGHEPGKQPGAESSTLRQVSDPDETVVCAPSQCGGCGENLAGAVAVGVQRLQEFDIVPPPPPRVTEYRVQATVCERCGTVTAGRPPAGITGRAQYGPEVHAQAANLATAHHVPVARAAELMSAMTGVTVSSGWMAGVRGKAAARLEPFMERTRELLRAAGVIYADETPARAAGGLQYMHVACTDYLTCMHTGGRSAADIDAGDVLPGYAGTIVRDGYADYEHLADALHAWCGAHNLRDLPDLYTFDPDGQVCGRSQP
jgi:transposase